MRVNKAKYMIVMAVVMLAFTAACSSSEDSQVSPESQNAGLPTLENSDMLVLTAPNGWNSFKIDDPISLIVQNVSDKEIVFDTDYSVQLYVQDNGRWVQIENKMTYGGLDEIILAPSKEFDPTKIGEAYFLPDLSGEKDQELKIKIFITGKTRDRNELVVGSIDVLLHSN